MAFYIAALAHAFMPAVMAVGLWRPSLPGGREGAGHERLAIVAGLALGAAAAGLGLTRLGPVAVGTWLQAFAFAAVLAGWPALAAARLAGRSWGAAGLLAQAGLLGRGLFELGGAVADHGLSAAGVVNTDLLVNLAALACGAALTGLLAWCLRRAGAVAGGGPSALLLAASLGLALLGGSGQVLLGLLRLEMVTVTAGRISYVARLTQIEPWFAYLDLLLALVLAAAAWRRRHRAAPAADPVGRRLQRALMLGQSRGRWALAGTAGLLLAVLAYQDLYASRPPSLSPAASVTADGNGEIRFAIESVKDGKLHRFAYVTSDGHRVRFFLINRYDPAHADIGVVFDACMICADAGYIQAGDEIVCVACNVRMFRPSIGKPGGCNPIPLAHRVEAGAIVVAADALEKGAKFFPETVAVPHKDLGR